VVDCGPGRASLGLALIDLPVGLEALAMRVKRQPLGREGREILTGPVLRIGVVEIGKAVAS